MADNTSFSTVYDRFLSRITDDMYVELLPAETNSMLQDLMLNALFKFDFPRVDIFDYNTTTSEFNVALSSEEINIISIYMVVEWIGIQLANIENIRMKYSGSDFKFTSQANHLAKLQELKQFYNDEGFHLQRLYKRRIKDEKTGLMVSTIPSIMGD